jgi:transcriptional regulator with XRE-family HTH domain
MRDIENALRIELRDPEYSEGYAESFLNAYVATQIKVIREQREMTQADLANKIGTTQAGISRIENINYSSWSIRTLTKLARAFSVRLRVSFEPYGTLPDEVVRFDRESLERVTREEDPGLLLRSSPMGSALGNKGGNLVSIDSRAGLGRGSQRSAPMAEVAGNSTQAAYSFPQMAGSGQ